MFILTTKNTQLACSIISVTWNGFHNIQETSESGYSNCNSAEYINNQIVGDHYSGHQENVNSLFANAGETRYFVCTYHCSSGKKFKISCPSTVTTTTTAPTTTEAATTSAAQTTTTEAVTTTSAPQTTTTEAVTTTSAPQTTTTEAATTSAAQTTTTEEASVEEKILFKDAAPSCHAGWTGEDCTILSPSYHTDESITDKRHTAIAYCDRIGQRLCPESEIVLGYLCVHFAEASNCSP